MIEREVRITNALGIHARPASLIVQLAKNYHSDIFLEKDGISADAKSIMSVMMLAAAYDSSVRITVRGKDEAAATDALMKLFEGKFNEE